MKTKKELLAEIEELRARLEEAEDTLRAIRSGEVHALVVSSPEGEQVCTLRGSAKAIAKGEPIVGQVFEVQRFDGSRAFVINRSSPVRDAGGRIIGSAVAITDITAHREAEMKYSKILATSLNGFWITDTQGRLLEVNEALCRMLGYTREELLALSIADVEVVESPMEVQNHIAALQQKKLDYFVSRHRRKDGSIIDVEVNSTWLDIGEGQLVGFMHDITEQKQAEHALRKSKERFELLAETASKLLAADKPQKVVNDLCQKVMTHLDCHAFLNYLVDDEKGRLHLNACAGIPEKVGKEIEWLDDGVAVCGCAARDASRIVAEDIPNTPDPRTELVKSFGIKAYACHPLYSGGRVIGTLSFGTRSRPAFAEEDLSLMKTVADQVAMAMERMRLIEALRRSHDELELRVHRRTVELTKANQELQSEIVERKRTEEALRKITYDLNQRVKEINCLYSISYYVGKQYALLEEKLLNIVNLIPSGWQYPEITCARIILGGKEYKSNDFKETPWRQASDILIRDERIGTAEVYYLEEKPTGEEGPFLKEERRLIQAIAVELGEMIAHMRAEKTLAEQSKILEGFFTSTITPLVFLDRDFNFIRVNEAYANACRRQISDFRGHNHFEFYPSAAQKIFEQVVESKVPYQAIAQPFTFPDFPERGVTYWDWTLTPLVNESGEVELLVFSLQDATERKQAEKIIRLQAEQLATMLATTPDGFWVFDTDGKLLDVNDAYCRMSGYSPEEALRLYIRDVEALETPEDTARHIRNVMGTRFDRFETKHRTKDGQILDVEVSVSFWQAMDRFLLFIRDITERKRMEEALRESENRLRLLSSQLLTAQETERRRIALELHDSIGQMLTAIKFKAENYIQEKEKSGAKDTSFEAIISMIKDTIEEVRRMQMDLRPSTLDDLGILATLTWFCREYQKVYSHIRIDKEIAIREDEVAPPLKVVVYRLTQEAMNNIAKHSRAGLVRLSLRKQSNKLEWAVEDNGMGFDMETIISSSGPKRGMGLGSMRERTELSGGTFLIESIQGKGTTLRASWLL